MPVPQEQSEDETQVKQEACETTTPVQKIPQKSEQVLGDLHSAWNRDILEFCAAVGSKEKPKGFISDGVRKGNGRNKSKVARTLDNALSSARKLRKVSHKSSGKMEDAWKKWDAAIDGLQMDVEDTIVKIEKSIDSYKDFSLSWKRKASEIGSLDPSVENVKAICSYAHKICYTSFAPPGYKIGDPLRLFKPPCPQEQQLAMSQLYTHSEKINGSEPEIEDMKPTISTEKVEVPADWKPGDPLPGQSLPSEASHPPQEETQPTVLADKSPGPSSTPFTEMTKDAEEDGQGYNFTLNPDLDEVEDDESSDDFSEDEW